MFSDRLQLQTGDLGTPALIGVSGGRDSVALLRMLLDLGHAKLTVCHLDHGLRSESVEDAVFVASLCRRLGLPCHSVRVDVGELAQTKKQSTETAARTARYSFFASVAKELGINRVFLAHHADDQVETFLFNLFRGSGTAGLRGMRPVSSRTIDGVELQLRRPMLGIWRREIDAFVSKQNLPYREDHSNADPRHTRNRVRGEIMPFLEGTFGRDVRPALWRAAEILGAEDEWIEASLALDAEEAPAEIPVARVGDLPVAIQRRLLHRWLHARGIADVSFEDVEAVRALLGGGRPAKVNLAGGFHARRRAGKLFIEGPGE